MLHTIGELAASKYNMGTTGIIIFSIIVLHLLAGFIFLAYKLRPKKKRTQASD
ncbi:MAG: hypothetical protein IPP72_15625 [Chitinophagaceae bacterium]|nr:hypothetical protein [Chitinophagaceae bacterium]